MKKFLCFLLIALFLISPALAADGDTTVYITYTGECYHLSGCSYLKSRIETTLQDAVDDGYRACSRCNPPRLTSSPRVSSSSPSLGYGPSDELSSLGEKYGVNIPSAPRSSSNPANSSNASPHTPLSTSDSRPSPAPSSSKSSGITIGSALSSFFSVIGVGYVLLLLFDIAIIPVAKFIIGIFRNS